MLKLDGPTFQEVVDLLAPLAEQEGDRRALFASALGMECKALDDVSWTGGTVSFLRRAVIVLAEFGEFELGRAALWVPLESVRRQVGVDRQARIDRLHSVLNATSDVPVVSARGGDGRHLEGLTVPGPARLRAG